MNIACVLCMSDLQILTDMHIQLFILHKIFVEWRELYSKIRGVENPNQNKKPLADYASVAYLPKLLPI